MTTKFKHTYAEQNALLRDLQKIFKYGDEREFMQVLRKYGIKDQDSRFAEILKCSAACGAGRFDGQSAQILAHRLRLENWKCPEMNLNDLSSPLGGLNELGLFLRH